MSLPISAIDDGGVLKPATPLALPDQAHASIKIRSSSELSQEGAISKQKEALQALWAELDKLPQVINNDGWSVTQHDELLYGNP